MVVLILVILLLNACTVHVAEENMECKKDREWKCRTETKCISKDQVCDGRIQCPNGEDELGCSSKYCSALHRTVMWKCPGGNQTKCIPIESVCDGSQ